jgi:ubiquitin-like protein Pup
MASGEQTRKPKPKQDEESAQVEETKAEASSTEEIDDLLEEIDSVLEVNSEEFVRGFVQKGGELIIMLAFVVTFFEGFRAA